MLLILQQQMRDLKEVSYSSEEMTKRIEIVSAKGIANNNKLKDDG
jgi:hypothetical protein